MVGNLPPTGRMLEKALQPGGRFGERFRRGFTLVELLVVIAIVLLLISITVLVVPAAVEGQRASQGAVLLQGWLVQAQQRALLDQAPRGLRLFPDPNNPNFLTRAQFIERPDDFTGPGSYNNPNLDSQISSYNNQSNQLQLFLPGNTGITIIGEDSSGKPWPLDPIQPGDYIEVLGGGTMHRIEKVTSVPGSNGLQAILTLSSKLPQVITQKTRYFRIERAPRLQGDEPMPLPASVGVDITVADPRPPNPPNPKYGYSLPLNMDSNGQPLFLDILFSPRGEVLGNPGTDKIILWLRDMSQPSEFSGSPTLIVVFTRSGRIGAYPVNPDPNNPYALVQ
jgi:prepilin-type N-terminal cleavage/methylation domain-containing protein